MSFTSWEYLVFLPTLALLTFCVPRRARPLLLLVGSYVFYTRHQATGALVLLAVTAIAYGVGRGLPRLAGGRRRALLTAGLVGCLGMLAYFKYAQLILSSLAALLRPADGGIDLLTDLLLPLGISFFTFQACGYMIDVYRGKVPPEGDPITFALFLSFFPLVLSGPIERAGNLLPQLRAAPSFRYDDVVAGLRQVLFGLFKKVVIADMLGAYVNPIFNNLDDGGYRGQTLALAAAAYTIQIYCDFSGYSDIAIGSARILGYRLRDNFNMPYFSGSFTEFWARWHISLSTWFRDYLYIPLGGNRGGLARKCNNLLIVFAVSGLWHGADWKFLIWGLIHGVFRVAEEIRDRARGVEQHASELARERRRHPPILGSLVVFVGATVAWVFFRANSLSDAVHVLWRMLHPEPWRRTWEVIHEVISVSLLPSQTTVRMWLVIVGLALIYLFVSELIIYARQAPREPYTPLAYRTAAVRWVHYIVLTVAVIWCWLLQSGAVGQSGEFIYFKF